MQGFPLIPSLLLLVLSVGCASKAPRLPEEHVLRYEFSLEDHAPAEAPYLIRWETPAQRLDYLAAEHYRVDPKNTYRDHPTMKWITSLIQKNSYDLVLLEGFDTGDTNSPPELQKKAAECVKANFKSNCGESFWAAHLASSAGIPFASVEPRHTHTKQALLAAGYSDTDVLGFYVARQIPQWKRQRDFPAGDTPEAYAQFGEKVGSALQRFRKSLQIEASFGFDEFETWYAKNMSLPQNPRDIENKDAAPHGGKEASFLQKVSNEVCLVRDQWMVREMARRLQTTPRILVVLGASHYLTQKPALEALLGSGTLVPPPR